MGPESWFLLNVAEVDSAFLQKPVDQWNDKDSYVNLHDFIKKINALMM